MQRRTGNPDPVVFLVYIVRRKSDFVRGRKYMYFLPSPSRQLAINNVERHATQTDDGSAKTIVMHRTTAL